MSAKESAANETGARHGGAAQPGTLATPPELLAAEALDAIGYEAADPGLHAPLWGEAIRASGTSSSLR